MPATIEQRIRFRNTMKTTFDQIEKEFGILSKIGLIQSAHESNWGLSQLAAVDKNLFGITPGVIWKKAMKRIIPMTDVTNWSKHGAPTCYYPTTEYSSYPPNKIRYWEIPGDIVEKRDGGKGGSILTVNRYFRKYADWDESAWDWARKIAKEERYQAAHQAAKLGDVPLYGSALVQAGYATDKSYGNKLVELSKAIDDLPMV